MIPCGLFTIGNICILSSFVIKKKKQKTLISAALKSKSVQIGKSICQGETSKEIFKKNELNEENGDKGSTADWVRHNSVFDERKREDKTAVFFSGIIALLRYLLGVFSDLFKRQEKKADHIKLRIRDSREEMERASES